MSGGGVRNTRSWVVGAGFRGLGSRSWVVRAGFRGLGSRSWVVGAGFRGLGSRSWVVGAGLGEFMSPHKIFPIGGILYPHTKFPQSMM